MEFKKINISLKELFDNIDNLIININHNNFNSLNHIIILIILFCINNIFLLNKLLNIIKTKIEYIKDIKQKYLLKIIDIEYNLNKINIDLLKSYNKLSINKNNLINIDLLNYEIKYNINENNNLELFDLNNIDDLIINSNRQYKKQFNFKNDKNYIDYKNINIGFNNYYKLHCFKYLMNSLPFNLLIYINEINQVIIKIGDNNKYKYINSKLYPVYLFNEKNINNNSIICNNNIKELNKKCNVENCRFYHDYIIGYKDNYHLSRQFSSNPIVYNCNNFKDGSKVKENIKKIEWHEAINLYQSSLSNILIGCIHSLK